MKTNINTENHNHLKVAALTVLLVVFTFFMGSINIQAQEEAPANVPQEAVGDPNNLCEPAMKDIASKKMQEYLEFLDVNFSNKSSTDSLTPVAIDKYRQMRRELYEAYSDYFPNAGSLFLISGLQPGGCLGIVEDTLTDARTLLKIHAIKTSGIKKSAALIEKYQSINGQLVELNRQFINMKAYFDSFASKLPCYVKKGACLR